MGLFFSMENPITSPALAILARISPSYAKDYGDFCAVGTALKAIDDTLFFEWIEWGKQCNSPHVETLQKQQMRMVDWENFLPNVDGLEMLQKLLGECERKHRKDKRSQLKALREIYAGKLRYNTMTKQVEIWENGKGKPCDPELLYLDIMTVYNMDVSKDFANDVFLYIAKENSYHPVREYLDSCAHYKDTSLLDAPAQRYLGTTDPIYDIYLRKTLISAVARIYAPGCKVDTALILQGGQGLGKSSFFETLAGKEWFDDSLSPSTSDKDEKLKLHSTWFTEWAEIESVFRRRDVAAVRAFLTCKVDKFRAPFTRSTASYPRQCVIVGTVNPDEFLADPEGSRRFWVIPVTKPINLELLERERDQLWGAAVALFRAGEPWYLPKELEEIRGELNKEFEGDHPWADPIRSYLGFKTQVKVGEILEFALEIPKPQWSKGQEMTIAKILKSLGWEKKRTSKEKFWVRGGQVDTNHIQSRFSNSNGSHISGHSSSHLSNTGHQALQMPTSNQNDDRSKCLPLDNKVDIPQSEAGLEF